MYLPLKVAAISMKPKKWDKEYNAEKMKRLFIQAAEEGVQVAVITECALEGYTVNEVIEHPELVKRFMEMAEPIDGLYIKSFRELAKSLTICLSIGFSERVNRDVYNCAAFIDHNGEICGKYHKAQFAEGYHTSWNFNRIGDKVRTFDTPYGRAGFLICNDRSRSSQLSSYLPGSMFHPEGVRVPGSTRSFNTDEGRRVWIF